LLAASHKSCSGRVGGEEKILAYFGSSRNKFLFGLLAISLMLLLVFAAPHAYADDETLPVPLTPTGIVRFPGYHPVKTTGFVIPPGAVRGGVKPSTGKSAILPKGLKQVCSAFSGAPSGIVTVAGGQVIEDWVTGNLWFYSTASKTCTLMQTPPPTASVLGYFGLAVMGKLVAVITFGIPTPGLYLCTYYSGSCTSTSAFIPLPAVFCASMPAGFCNPNGAAFDPGMNLWYVDFVNGVEVELTAASHYSAVGVFRSYTDNLKCIPNYPVGTCAPLLGITIDSKGNHWVVDTSCAGNVYDNGIWQFSVGDDLSADQISTLNPTNTAHLYLAVENYCGNYQFPFVGEPTKGIILPHPWTYGWDEMPGISTLLYFTDLVVGYDSIVFLSDYVWLTIDTV
jgi:hypothetical protein